MEIWDNGDVYMRHIYTESGANSTDYMAFIKTPLQTVSSTDAINYIVGHTSAGTQGINVNSYAESFDIYSTTSDENLKTNIVDSEVEALPLINGIRLISFNWKNTGKYQAMGFSAQQLETLCKDFVSRVKQPEGSQYKEILQVMEFNMLPYMIGAIQDLTKQVNELKKEIEELKKGENNNE